MFVPVLATRTEFERYGKAQRTYDETVRALAGLTEGAGYVPQGHQARVADLCVKIGREMSLPAERVRELELVALLHDVGAVSLADPSDVARVHPEEVARSTGRMLEETEYLARYAPIVLDAARGTRDLPIEGRILRVADAYDRLSAAGWDDAKSIERAGAAEDAEVVGALRRVLKYS
jgi:HD-GYP domain-containing protein (c-di-GMP phosphodiesterase class II)